jgi:hypothetical protein
MIRGVIIFGLVILAIHAGIVFGSPVVKNRLLEARMHEVAQNRAMKSEDALRRDMMEFISEKGIPLQEDDLIFTKSGDQFQIAARYQTEARLWFYSRLYDFAPASDPSAALKPAPRRNPTGQRSSKHPHR